MKPQTMPQVPGAADSDANCVSDVSAEAALHRKIVELDEWLTAQGLDLRADHAHADEGSRDRLYWRYGYFIGLKHALAILTNRGATVH